jgi:hypothetical protein
VSDPTPKEAWKAGWQAGMQRGWDGDFPAAEQNDEVCEQDRLVWLQSLKGEAK